MKLLELKYAKPNRERNSDGIHLTREHKINLLPNTDLEELDNQTSEWTAYAKGFWLSNKSYLFRIWFYT